jgi:hypothetical protein
MPIPKCLTDMRIGEDCCLFRLVCIEKIQRMDFFAAAPGAKRDSFAVRLHMRLIEVLTYLCKHPDEITPSRLGFFIEKTRPLEATTVLERLLQGEALRKDFESNCHVPCISIHGFQHVRSFNDSHCLVLRASI